MPNTLELSADHLQNGYLQKVFPIGMCAVAQEVMGTPNATLPNSAFAPVLAKRQVLAASVLVDEEGIIARFFKVALSDAVLPNNPDSSNISDSDIKARIRQVWDDMAGVTDVDMT